MIHQTQHVNKKNNKTKQRNRFSAHESWIAQQFVMLASILINVKEIANRDHIETKTPIEFRLKKSFAIFDLFWFVVRFVNRNMIIVPSVLHKLQPLNNFFSKFHLIQWMTSPSRIVSIRFIVFAFRWMRFFPLFQNMNMIWNRVTICLSFVSVKVQIKSECKMRRLTICDWHF